jgi:hypothetical protein
MGWYLMVWIPFKTSEYGMIGSMFVLFVAAFVALIVILLLGLLPLPGSQILNVGIGVAVVGLFFAITKSVQKKV